MSSRIKIFRVLAFVIGLPMIFVSILSTLNFYLNLNLDIENIDGLLTLIIGGYFLYFSITGSVNKFIHNKNLKQDC